MSAPDLLNISAILLKFATEIWIYTIKNQKLKKVIITSFIVNSLIMGIIMMPPESEYFLSGLALIEVIRSIALAIKYR